MKYIVKNKHWDLVEDYNCDKLLYLLVDRPDKINLYNMRYDFWENDKYQWHRDYDLPSQVSEKQETSIFWRKNGKKHRENNKSAIIYANGTKYSFINDIKI